MSIGVIRNPQSGHEFYDEKGPARFGSSCVEHASNVRVIHHCQGLALGFEARDHRLGVHPQLNNFERDSPPHRLLLFREVDDSATAFADPLDQTITAYSLADF